MKSVERGQRTAALKAACKQNGWTSGTYYRFQKGWYLWKHKGLADARFGRLRQKLSQEQEDYILSLIKQNPDRRITRIWEYIVLQFPDNPVSGATVRRFVEKWKTDNHESFLFSRDPDAWKGKYQLAFGSESQKAYHFNQWWELDSTIADLMCADGKRYALIGCIDIYTRKVKVHVSPTSSSHGIACVLRSAILDWGLPENIMRDNGKDYDSKHVNGICESLGITPHNAPPFTPEKKPHIERFFRTLSSNLFEELRGYIGHSVAERKALESRRSFAQRFMGGGDPIPIDLSPNQLQKIINQWIEVIYHQRVHGGIGTSPEARAAQSAQPPRRVADTRALDLLLQPVGDAVVSKKGIRYRNGHYFAPALAGYVGERVQVRVDQDSAGTLYAFDNEGRYLFTAFDESLSDLSAGEFKVIKQRRKKELNEMKRAIQTLSQEPMVGLLEAQQSQPKLKALPRRRTAELATMDEANRALEQYGVTPQKYKSIAQQIAESEGREWNDKDDDLRWMENVKIINE